MKNIILLAVVLAVVSCDGLDYWKAVKSDPLNWVNRPLPRYIVDGDQNVHLHKWNKDDPHFQNFNSKWRSQVQGDDSDSENLGRPWKGDTPQSWFGTQSFVSDISKLPTSGQASAEPWSSTYWPIQYGILSLRYASNEKNTIVDDQGNRLTWQQSVDKYHEPQDYQNATSGDINQYVSDYFSPAEKYDLLVGDTSAFTLTNNNKNQGKGYANSNGDVESWMGICHGWAPAAFSLPRPQNDVTVTAADGKTQVKFYADDIRGLASLKYAATEYENLFVGGRCNTPDAKIKKDPESGLIIDYTCFDVNPATWTIILANRIGVQKKSFVIDATFDFQVWNQPVYGYSFNFFNPLNDTQGDLESSKIKISDLDSRTEPVLKFVKKMVSKQATHLVGVTMQLTYIAETNPTHQPPGEDRKVQVEYVYTLELDDQNNILGGEWLHNQHPDFLWAPAEGAKPMNDEDNQIASSIQGDISSPDTLKQLTSYAQSASSRGEVLDKVVEYLVAKSSAATLRESSVSEIRRLKAAYEKASNEYLEFLAKH